MKHPPIEALKQYCGNYRLRSFVGSNEASADGGIETLHSPYFLGGLPPVQMKHPPIEALKHKGVLTETVPCNVVQMKHPPIEALKQYGGCVIHTDTADVQMKHPPIEALKLLVICAIAYTSQGSNEASADGGIETGKYLCASGSRSCSNEASADGGIETESAKKTRYTSVMFKGSIRRLRHGNCCPNNRQDQGPPCSNEASADGGIETQRDPTCRLRPVSRFKGSIRRLRHGNWRGGILEYLPKMVQMKHPPIEALKLDDEIIRHMLLVRSNEASADGGIETEASRRFRFIVF